MKRSVLVLVLFLAACNRIPPSVRDVFLDRAPSPSVTVDVICDASSGRAGCTPSSLDGLLVSVVPSLSSGSVIRLYGLSDDVADSAELGRYVLTPADTPAPSVVRDHGVQELAVLKDRFEHAAAPLFRVPRRASPIAMTIARVVLAGSVVGVQHVVVLTDAREVSRTSELGNLDFECRGVPPDFPERLGALFPKGSLRGVHVHFVNADLAPVDGGRCQNPDTASFARLRDAWIEGLSRKGAIVTWSMGPIGGLE